MAFEGVNRHYHHYKGGVYVVIGLALREGSYDRATGAGVTDVIYAPVEPSPVLRDRQESFWSRELSDFNAEVEVDGQLVPRFRPGDVTFAAQR